MAFAEDLSVFFDPAMPGVVTGTINAAAVNGSLDYLYDESMESPTRRGVPAFICATADLPTVNIGDTLTIGARAYKVREIEADDWDPITILHLNNP